MNQNLIYDQPRSQGVSNALRRAKQLLDVQWTPLLEYACNSKNFIYSTRSGKEHTTPEQYTGFPYSSSRVKDHFIGLDVLMDTFLSALQNPASILYTCDLSDFDEEAFNCTIRNTFTAYGVVCSAFVNYVLALPLHRSTHEWGISPEFFKIPEQSADWLELCDTVVTSRPGGGTGGHVRIITGIARDEEGHVKQVEISEGITPVPGRAWYSAEEFNATLTDPKDRYQIFRYRYLDDIEYTPSQKELGTSYSSDLMLNLGDYSNYIEGDPVEFYIPNPADRLVITGTRHSRSVDIRTLPPTTVLGHPYPICRITDLEPDEYTAYVVKDEKPSLPVHFIVNRLPSVALSRADGTAFPRIALKLTDPDGAPLTRQSSCLVKEDGTWNDEIVNIALSDGDHLYPARAAVREKNGRLMIRTAAALMDEEGKIFQSFCLEDDPTLYAFAAEEGAVCRAAFSDTRCCTPTFLSWKEEAFITYHQRILTTQEQNAGTLSSVLRRHLNDFTHFSISSVNKYGRVATKPIPFIICKQND